MKWKNVKLEIYLGGGNSNILGIFTPIWGRFPFWPILFRWVETTNQLCWSHLVTRVQFWIIFFQKWIRSFWCVSNLHRRWVHFRNRWCYVTLPCWSMWRSSVVTKTAEKLGFCCWGRNLRILLRFLMALYGWRLFFKWLTMMCVQGKLPLKWWSWICRIGNPVLIWNRGSSYIFFAPKDKQMWIFGEPVLEELLTDFVWGHDPWVDMYICHGPPKPAFLEVFMLNHLVFRWPKPLFFMVLGAHSIYSSP